ncbi:MAG: FmdE family protein [Methanoregula sp.]|uniref:FmdE family protein n=1 Tax=Methanoregula sp. TaxID=2052170 RepID=UPI0025EFA7D7|nr:FmdE family protein [Methanoregula sp.]MCK9632430.1 FmdE family protein [Methanoregula sp.]
MHDHNHDHGHHHHHDVPHAVTFDDCVRFHGHSCPGLASGYRAATAAMEALGVSRPEDEDLVAICETDACGVDAIQVIAGTTAGKGNLIVHDYGKHAFTFFNRKDGKAVRITFHRNEATETGDIAGLRKKVFSGNATEMEEELFHELMHKATVDLLHAPAEKIMKIESITMEAPKKARIFASVTCECCGESVADAKTRKVDGKCVCIPCAEGTHPSQRK